MVDSIEMNSREVRDRLSDIVRENRNIADLAEVVLGMLTVPEEGKDEVAAKLMKIINGWIDAGTPWQPSDDDVRKAMQEAQQG